MVNSISLVVIGKNDQNNLKKIYTQQKIKELKKIFTEFIYVDSCSNDSSRELMSTSGFDVYQICAESFKSASGGRYIGAEESNCEYILFLDSDMDIKQAELINQELKLSIQKGFVGFVGDVIDIYPSGNSRKRIRQKKKNNCAISFGGFVLIDRAVLLEAGNWNANVPANEELELQARLKNNGAFIYKTDKISVSHFTIVEDPLRELLGLYFPLRKSRYGALGYALYSAVKHKSLLSLLSLIPEFCTFSILILALFMSLISSNFIMLPFLLLLYIFIVIKNRSVKYLVVPPGLFISFLYGVYKYRESKVKYEKSI